MGLQNPEWVWQVDQDLWLRILAESNLYVIPKFLTYPRIHSMQGTVYLDKRYVFIKTSISQDGIGVPVVSIYFSYCDKKEKTGS